ncbi:hypothetical protein SAMN02745163_01596 [Clostridium cavendishii DSM 21758]|uniref:Lipoprotein n=1 Tax=Clostridium cavendishii DSM 21758 TaxID=1121302 RepID=A0A1M6HVE6_9CLOT|nr:hypothetical protein [Clostridium cavendishii]SHJ26189.1 hypothetical protein SAMN02745163_01596 [Clostridium cavendishii DSM 21758]
MKKKIALLIIVSILSVNLLACGSKKENVKNDKNSTVEDSSKKEETTKKEEPTKKEESTKTQSTAGKSNEAKPSTLKAPLEIGQTGIASKIAAKDPNLHNSNVSLTNIIRGEEAKKLVDEFNSNHRAVQIAPLESSQLEYAVAEYDITIPEDFPHDIDGPGIEISSEINGLDGEGLVYDGVLYVNTTCDISPKGSENVVLKPNVPGKGRFAFTIPKGCTNYLVLLGEFDGTKAYFKGK